MSPDSKACNSAGSRYDFGTMAPRYDEWYETPRGRKYDRIQKNGMLVLLPRPRRGARLLDVGCGTGHWSRFFAALGYSVTGVDVSPQMIGVACQHDEPRCRFLVADACRLPFRDGAFDVVAAVATLAFVRDQRAALTEMFRCTRSGGRVIVGALNKLAPINRRRVSHGKQPYASGKLLTPRQLRAILGAFGEETLVKMIPPDAPGGRVGAGRAAFCGWRSPQQKSLIVAAAAALKPRT